MALDLTPEQKAVGAGNFQRVVGKMAEADRAANRREFMQGLIGAGAIVPITAAAYYGYGRDASFTSMRGHPVKAALIGCGDEGGVLANEHDPNYVNIVAVSDIRPSNLKRIFDGDVPANARRRGLKYHYGHNADKDIKVFEKYQDLLADRDLGIEMVIIALPLPLHHKAVMDCLKSERIKGVLCEKLMAWNVTQCKEMIREADNQHKLLAIGHQRHYSTLYAHANEVVQSGILGDIRYIRALWHRNNAVPRLDSNGHPMMETYNTKQIPVYKDSWRKAIPAEDAAAIGSRVRDFGWKDMNELVRWRLYRRTGGGLMVELGSHQLDACSIFLGKKHPIAVSGVGGKNFYQDERECEDNIYCTFEFPGAHYEPGHPHYGPDGKTIYNDIVNVTYSSISNNAFEAYGECVMGSKGTMVTEREQAVYLYGGAGRSTEVTANASGGRPAIEASSSTAPIEKRAQEVGAGSIGPTVSYGYTEELTHMAYCIKNREAGLANPEDPRYKPRCDGRAAMADAIIALTANQAMRRNQRIVFKSEWFDASKPDVPDPDMQAEPA
ncbi:MAG TPA: Gfo/Idh/MocA family oxidoreductase [Gemmataceae bacterium]|jgi:predicted dehydrogenase|nr:Gfo/Idh/MocA family oxidoreductase [Gemmataceae bacterium]